MTLKAIFSNSLLNKNIKQDKMNRYESLVSLFIIEGKVRKKKSLLLELLSLSSESNLPFPSWGTFHTSEARCFNAL